jgi:hypothetical protein
MPSMHAQMSRMRPIVAWVVAAIAVLIAILPAASTPTAYAAGPAEQPGCGFTLGFKALRDQIPQVVGQCLENERVNQANGNTEQRTTGGLLVWRKADNWTAFTDGTTTWLNGPQGLESRPNTERFPWEQDAAPGALAPIRFTRFGSAAAFADGTLTGTRVQGDTLTLEPGVASGTWVSPLVEPGFPFSRLVASWNAATPADSWVQVEVQATTESGSGTKWYTLGIWSDSEGAIKRTSVNGQDDADATVETDTLRARGRPLVGYQLRVTLQRPTADHSAPALRLVGAVASPAFSLPGESRAAAITEAVELPVPSYSQEIHAGRYPQWGGGGEVWCSPTSTEMVVEYWRKGPSAQELAWVDPRYSDPSVIFAARATYDPAYRGTGNWPFNTAYAARYGLEAFVTQLRSLGEAEQFIRAGIPLVASIKAGPRELDGFLFEGGTNGHLVVVVGFDGAGNPIVNDPAAWTNATVRRVYDRGQFERAWLRGSGGIVYVIHPPEVPLPPSRAGGTPNW